jgi:hypothetical protein
LSVDDGINSVNAEYYISKSNDAVNVECDVAKSIDTNVSKLSPLGPSGSSTPPTSKTF